MQAFRTAFVSTSLRGGRGGRSLYGKSGRNGMSINPSSIDMSGGHVVVIDIWLIRVDDIAFYRHIISATSRLFRSIG